MANFLDAYIKTMGHEGGYVHDPDDNGGETYKGIARKFWSSWSGWNVIDTAKTEDNFPDSLSTNGELNEAVKRFYKENFWDAFGFDDVDSQAVAEEVFDTGVNAGVKRATIFLQRALNALNLNEKTYANIKVDGSPGPGTRTAIKALFQTSAKQYVLRILNGLQLEFYISLMEKNESQEKYVGWFNRV